MFGSIKVIDGLFITDEIAAHVSSSWHLGPWIHIGEQGQAYHQLFWSPDPKSLVFHRNWVPDSRLERWRTTPNSDKCFSLWPNLQVHRDLIEAPWQRYHSRYWNAKHFFLSWNRLSYDEVQMDIHKDFRILRYEETDTCNLSTLCDDVRRSTELSHGVEWNAL